MGNVASAAGQLMRAGTSALPFKKKKKLKASKAHVKIQHHLESRRFLEQNQGMSAEKTKRKRVYLVTIIEEGLGNSKDKNYYSAEALKTAPKLFNNAKAYADHPSAIEEKTLPERSMKDLVGWYSDCVVDSNPATGKARLRGKLHFFPSAKWLTDMIDTILEDKTAKDLFGISINAIGRTRPAQMGGQMVNYVETFQRVDSADVVTEPAARGKFEKMLESRRSTTASAGRAVTPSGRSRMREAASITPKKAKDISDALTAAYHSDDPDEMKEALFSASRELYAASSVSGEGPGQVNEEQSGNTNLSGGKEAMAKLKLKASGLKRHSKSKKRFMAAAGTGADNENLPEPDPENVASQIEEADVDEEEGEDLGAVEDFGDSSKHVKASGKKRLARRRPAAEAEEDEDEDEQSLGAAPPAASGSSRSVMSADGEEEEMGGEEDLGMDDMGGEEDLGLEDEEEDLGEAEEDEGMEDEAEEDEAEAVEAFRIPLTARRKSQEVGVSVSGGKSGKASLPKHATGEYDEDYSKSSRDASTGGAGKSYKIKTSKFRRNKPSHKLARRVAHEANRRIGTLEDLVVRLRESKRASEREVSKFRGIIRFHNSKVTASKWCREAVRKEILPEDYARVVVPQLYGLSEQEQILEIKRHARLLESTSDSVLARLTESVEGVAGRGTAVSFGSGGNGHSDLAEAMAEDGIPMKEEKD